MSLPYPSMNFTPFDILTAAEMNQLVANDQALAAGTGLNDGSVLPKNLLTGTGSTWVWTDYASSSTIVGFTGTFTEKSIRYKQVGKIVYVYYNIGAASSGTTVSFTVPVAAKAIASGGSNSATFSAETNTGLVVNNSSLDTGPGRVYIDVAVNPNVVIVSRLSGSGSWTASGNRAIRGVHVYEAA